MDEQIEIIRSRVLRQIDIHENISEEKVAQIIGKEISQILAEKYLTITQRIAMCKEIYNSIRGYDVLQPLIEDESIT